MFDQLRKSMGLSSPADPSKKRTGLISHVIHFAAAPPDTSIKPAWNKDPTFDEITWETLPSEFKKVRVLIIPSILDSSFAEGNTLQCGHGKANTTLKGDTSLCKAKFLNYYLSNAF
jgi:hypothetical protein